MEWSHQEKGLGDWIPGFCCNLLPAPWEEGLFVVEAIFYRLVFASLRLPERNGVEQLLGRVLTEWFRFWIAASWTVFAWRALRRTFRVLRASAVPDVSGACRAVPSSHRGSAVGLDSGADISQ